jgi:hypothetical protein
MGAKGIDQHCKANNYSRATYYNQRRLGKGPREMRVGNRVLITDEAEADWHRAMEAETAQSRTPEAA